MQQRVRIQALRRHKVVQSLPIRGQGLVQAAKWKCSSSTIELGPTSKRTPLEGSLTYSSSVHHGCLSSARSFALHVLSFLRTIDLLCLSLLLPPAFFACCNLVLVLVLKSGCGIGVAFGSPAAIHRKATRFLSYLFAMSHSEWRTNAQMIKKKVLC